MLVRRSEFQNALVEALDPEVVKIHLGKRLQSYSHPNATSGPVELHFIDGETATCDVLVGADGIHSVTRMQMMHEYADEFKESGNKDFLYNVDPAWTGTYAYRYMIPAEKLASINPNHTLLTKPAIVSKITSCFYDA